MALSDDVLRKIVEAIRSKVNQIATPLPPGRYDLDKLTCDWRKVSDNHLFECMSVCVFVAGMKTDIVAQTWKGIREAFKGFNIDRVVSLNPSKLKAQSNIISHERKIKAVIHNAKKILDLQTNHISFRDYLQQGLDVSFDYLMDQIEQDFKYLRETSIRGFLKDIGMGGYKPDKHVTRIIERIDIAGKRGGNINIAINDLSKASGLNVSKIDRILFQYGSGHKLKYPVCGTQPRCGECPVPVCSYANRV